MPSFDQAILVSRGHFVTNHDRFYIEETVICITLVVWTPIFDCGSPSFFATPYPWTVAVTFNLDFFSAFGYWLLLNYCSINPLPWLW
jgi:hypothetical protein